MTVAVREFWRVGRRADPLHVDARRQGAGRFDDPERLVSMLYGAPALRTCLLEFLLPWAPGASAREVLQAIPQSASAKETIDAEIDRKLAAAPRRVPKSLYDRVAVRITAESPLALADLQDIRTRELLAQDDAVARELLRGGFRQLDRGALLSPYRALTQAITGAVLRGGLLPPTQGLYSESRHAGDIVVVFASQPFSPQLRVIEIEALMPSHSEVVNVAEELGLVP